MTRTGLPAPKESQETVPWGVWPDWCVEPGGLEAGCVLTEEAPTGSGTPCPSFPCFLRPGRDEEEGGGIVPLPAGDLARTDPCPLTDLLKPCLPAGCTQKWQQQKLGGPMETPLSSSWFQRTGLELGPCISHTFASWYVERLGCRRLCCDSDANSSCRRQLGSPSAALTGDPQQGLWGSS